ncbi:transcription-repair coupling factor [Suttonella sp. R2A3]|uniref:transcription-repair coupling factor n=1 Tax=Suttonella sp. R2A3 TaxID=2908648 RepID=UPI001F25FD8A|nr:transcription-repair coupling factor [Suttonella sp. R2A3]UJF24527.1 transcription-repair coupling factor [Suttonella sp. R2A3]
MAHETLKHLAYHLHNQLSGKHVHLVVTPDTRWAEYTYRCLQFWLPAAQHPSLYWFSDWETLPYDPYTPHPDLVSERLRVLAELPTRRQAVVVVAASTLRQRLCPQTHLDTYGIHLSIGDQLKREDFIARLAQAGYQSNTLIAQKGEFAARGSLVDLFPMGATHPIRLEWFDDEIESIRTFDIENQRTISKLKQMSILPRSELDLSDSGRVCFRQRAREAIGEHIINHALYQQVSDGRTPQGLEYYLPLFFDESASLFDYLPSQTRLVISDGVSEALHKHQSYCEKRFERTNPLRERSLLPPEMLWLNADTVSEQLARLERHTFAQRAQSIAFSGTREDREAQWLDLINAHSTAHLHLPGNGSREYWQERLLKSHPEAKNADHWDNSAGLNLYVSPMHYSFHDGEAVHLSEADLHTAPVAPNYRQKAAQDPASIIQSLQDLTIGAPVVHTDYGVGRYQGLQRLEDDDEELLTIEYAKGSRLFVPVTDLDLITRYSGGDPDSAPLHDIGGKQWQSNKRKISAKVRDTASELLALYAKREAAQGTPITLDHKALTTFAEDFRFDETPDQQHAIDTVLADLERSQPMDRIVCGDVGFGKTEVALRAAYATVLAGQQVALIAPTTLLANQHYHNFLDRCADYALNIDAVSRFNSASEQKASLEHLAAGKTDIIIGTHRLLQKDVQFANLGLVIIDEEQRFGVRHKEKLKSLRANVNLLTLTATPIPRTLNFALSGLRDISIIATPPVGRQSVQTIISDYDPGIIEEACERELNRGGQVFFLHNDISSIERVARSLQELLPQARIGMAHGQMRESALEHIMQDFYNRHYDILIATTIIESGIDIPNANTILINRADKLGLAQLHQLRGRVGRSHHQAYAYLFTPSWQTLNKDAQRRLHAFTTLDSLGAGFLLASQDLEIRGAGELLGDEQSGQIQQIGMSYYLDLLERAVSALKSGESFDPEHEQERVNIELHEPTLLPDDYIYDPHIRLICYQRLSQCRDNESIDELAVETTDRFGRLPQAAKNLFARAKLKLHAEALGIVAILADEATITLTFNADPNINTDALFALLQNNPGIYRMSGPTTLIKERSDEAITAIEAINELLDQLTKKP